MNEDQHKLKTRGAFLLYIQGGLSNFFLHSQNVEKKLQVCIRNVSEMFNEMSGTQ